jgi:hypothetical protein
MGIEQWWNDTGGRAEEPEEKPNILSQCLFFNHKSYVDWLGIKPLPLWWEVSD